MKASSKDKKEKKDEERENDKSEEEEDNTKDDKDKSKESKADNKISSKSGNKEERKDKEKEVNAESKTLDVDQDIESKKEISINQLFDLLGSLRQVLSRSTNICVEEKEYGINGYGPNAWTPKINDKISSRYTVMNIGRNKIPYVVRNPTYKMKVTCIDDIILETCNAVDIVLSNTMIFLKEPPSFRMLDQQRAEPELLGLPYSDLLNSGINSDLINNAIHRFLNPVRHTNNFNYSEGFVFDGSNLDDGLRDFFDISQREMRVLATSIEQEELRTRNYIPDVVKMPTYGNNILFEVVMNPFLITSMFTHIPRHVRFSAGMILELQKPDVTLGPIDISTLQKTASISMTRAASVSALFSIDYTPDMSEAINAFFISLITPGLIEFEVDLSDLNAQDHPLRMLTGCLAKLIFSRSNLQRWNNITYRGARIVEQAIADACISSYILTPAIHEGRLPLNRVGTVPGILIHDLNGIITDGVGGGWREGANQRLAPHPFNMPYVECSNRQRYVHDIEEIKDLDSPDRMALFNRWRVAATSSNLLSVANRNGEDRSSYSGVCQVYKLLANRIFDFYAVINEYNLRNWYSSLRLPESIMNSLYNDSFEEPTVVSIKGKTILYLCKSLSVETLVVRKTPYMSQVKAECAIARDCAESAIRLHIFNEVQRIYSIPENSFKASERTKFVKPKNGPLKEHMELLINSGLSSSIGPFQRCIENTTMYELLLTIANSIMKSPVDFGILPYIELGTQIADRSINTLEQYSLNDKPYTNIGVFEQDDEVGKLERCDISFLHMTNLIDTFSLRQTIRDFSSSGVVRLNLPLTYDVNTCSIIEEDDKDLINVKYDPKRADNNLRFCLNWKNCVINVTDVNHDSLQRPDLYVLNFSTINRLSIPRIFGNTIFLSAIEWLAQLEREATRCVYIRTDNVSIKSIFERK